MKIKLYQDVSKKETEVTITYNKMDNRLQKMIQSIRQYDYTICGMTDHKTFLIPLEEIFYFDCMEGKTFIYTDTMVYESQQNLLALEDELKNTSIIRIGKSNLMNVEHLKGVSPYPNHRLMAEMSNGEKLIISRKYIQNLKDWIRRKNDE